MTEPELRRFVILEHDHPFLHWDLLLEDGAALKSWRLLQPVKSGTWISAQALPDHRLHYLDYEGPVSGDRGSVKQIAAGRYRIMSVSIDRDRVRCYQLVNCPLATSAESRTAADTGNVEWLFE